MPETTQPESISLYYKEGSSDKVYQASIEPQGSGFIVNFAYGRRGSTMNTGTKTASPVDYAAARKIFDKLIAEKTAKGYTPGSEGTPYQGTLSEPRSTGILPQLLNPIDEDEAVSLINDAAWWVQEKYDGRRVLIQAAVRADRPARRSPARLRRRRLGTRSVPLTCRARISIRTHTHVWRKTPWPKASP